MILMKILKNTILIVFDVMITDMLNAYQQKINSIVT